MQRIKVFCERNVGEHLKLFNRTLYVNLNFHCEITVVSFISLFAFEITWIAYWIKGKNFPQNRFS